MPKFKMEQSYSLHKLLPEMGMESIFSNSANLTKLSHNEGLKVSEVSFQFNHNIKTPLRIPNIADNYFFYLSLKNPRCCTRLLLRWTRWGPLLQLPQQLALCHFLSPESSGSTDRSSSLYTMKTLTVCCSWAGWLTPPKTSSHDCTVCVLKWPHMKVCWFRPVKDYVFTCSDLKFVLKCLRWTVLSAWNVIPVNKEVMLMCLFLLKIQMFQLLNNYVCIRL